ncbi:hypothetical protein [Nostoc sp.]
MIVLTVDFPYTTLHERVKAAKYRGFGKNILERLGSLFFGSPIVFD